MAGVVTFVRGRVAPGRSAEVTGRYRDALRQGLPGGLERTWLLAGADGELAIVSLWKSRTALATMASSTDEPLARRLIREAGGQPIVTVYDVVADAGEQHAGDEPGGQR